VSHQHLVIFLFFFSSWNNAYAIWKLWKCKQKGKSEVNGFIKAKPLHIIHWTNIEMFSMPRLALGSNDSNSKAHLIYCGKDRQQRNSPINNCRLW
jgi:hypothetical protein